MTEEIVGVESSFTQINQEAEDYVCIWVAVYEAVVTQTRDSAQACYEAKQAWVQFQRSHEKIEIHQPELDSQSAGGY